MGMKRVPVRALKVPYSSKCTVFQGEAIRDDGKSPNPLFFVETADFRVDIFDRFFVDFWGAAGVPPGGLKNKKINRKRRPGNLPF